MDVAEESPAPEALPKLRFSCYLLKPDLPRIESALRQQYRPPTSDGHGGGRTRMSRLAPNPNLPGVEAFFHAKSEKIPPWPKALKGLFPELSSALNTSNRLVIFLPVRERYFAVCFGYGSNAETVRLAVAHGRRVPASGQTGGTKSDDVSLRIRRGADASIWVVDISDLNNPEEVALIPTSQDTRPGEGMQVLHIETAEFTGRRSRRKRGELGQELQGRFQPVGRDAPGTQHGTRDERPFSKGQ